MILQHEQHEHRYEIIGENMGGAQTYTIRQLTGDKVQSEQKYVNETTKNAFVESALHQNWKELIFG